MDKINGVGQIVKILQSQINKSKENSRTKKTKPGNKESVKPTSKCSVDELELKIAKKIARLDKKSSNYKNSAVVIFVEEILNWEFSTDITTDPEFSKLKEKITSAFIENKSLEKGFDNILSHISK